MIETDEHDGIERLNGRATVVDNPVLRRGLEAVAGVLGFYFVLQWVWPAPIGVLVQGLIVGGLTALVAFGLALIYRSNRIINFAQGDLGGAPAALAVVLILGPGVPYLLAFPVVILSAIVLGAFVEFVFIRRFFKAPRLILTVVTIGVSQLLAFLTVILPRVFDLTRASESFPSPLGISFNIGRQVFSGNEVIAIAAVPLVIVGLTLFLRGTNVGIAVRASAESADRAALLGVPVKRIQTIVWVVAAVLSATAMFLRAGIMGLPIGSALGPTILITALAAAVVGHMDRLPTIFVASLAIGVLEASLFFNTGRAILLHPILFLIVLVALLVQRRGEAPRVDEDQASSWQAAREVRPVPRELAGLPEVRWGLRGLTWACALFLVSLPLLFNEGQISLAALVVILAMVGVSLVILTGWAGQVSLGQVGFVGIGAAVGGYLTATQNWDLVPALFGAGLAGAAAALVIGLPALRIRGLFLAVVTLAFALAVSSFGINREFIHWLPEGRIDRPPLLGRIVIDTEARYYYFTLVAFLFTVIVARGIRQSRAGRVLIGIRENPRAAQSFGVNATTAKLMAFAISGFLAAFAGAVFVHHQQTLGFAAYTVDKSRDVFIMVVIGGLGSVPGAVLGATFIQGVEYFRNLFPEVVRPFLIFLSSGLGLIIVLLIIPGGFSQVFYDLRDRVLRKIAARRGIIVPSLVADARDVTPEVPAPTGAVDVPIPEVVVVAGVDGDGDEDELTLVSAGGNGSTRRRRREPLRARRDG